MAYTGKALRDTVMEKYREALSMKEKSQPADLKTPGYLTSLLESEFLNVPGVSAELKARNILFHQIVNVSHSCVFIFTPMHEKPPYCLFPDMYSYTYNYTVARVVEGRSLPYVLDFDEKFFQSDILDWVKHICETTYTNIRKLLGLVQNVGGFMANHGLTAKDIFTFKQLERDIRSLCVAGEEILCADTDDQNFEKSIYNEDYREKLVQDAVMRGIIGEPTVEDVGYLPISELQLTYRTENCLHRNNIHTVGDLLGTSISALQEFRGLGESTLKDILDALSLRGLKLRP